MLVLSLDTSSAATTVAVATVADGQVSVLAARVNVDARAHGEALAPAIAHCLDAAGFVPADLGAIVAGTGPGPYTGLRVGLVTAAALGDALSVPTYGVCSLDGIGARTRGRVLVAADARRREVYWGTYADGTRVDGPQVTKPADVPTGGYTAMAGAGARLYAEVLDLELLDLDYPDPATLIRVALVRIEASGPSEQLTPLYLRKPDAVEPGPRKSVLT